MRNLTAHWFMNSQENIDRVYDAMVDTCMTGKGHDVIEDDLLVISITPCSKFGLCFYDFAGDDVREFILNRMNNQPLAELTMRFFRYGDDGYIGVDGFENADCVQFCMGESIACEHSLRYFSRRDVLSLFNLTLKQMNAFSSSSYADFLEL